ncbi:DsbA family protein [Citreicoccus inhibens]|uniref:DsbA family protein n=1 Tax=Citreicoccus inhibens TaxID=2849499 RepID=UPI001EEFB92D|nr:DsbA family protein [Citreicoccus inhibens]
MNRRLMLSWSAVLLFPLTSLASSAAECDKARPEAVDARPTPRAATPRAEAPSVGPTAARVTVEVWSDFECPYCARGATTLSALRAKYGDRVRFVFRHLPLPSHPHARQAAAAAMAANEQGKFWEFHDALFANQDALERAGLEALARKLGLDVARFRGALDKHAWDSYVEADAVEARSRGVLGTPTFFVNSQAVTGAQPVEDFVRLIDAELAR